MKFTLSAAFISVFLLFLVNTISRSTNECFEATKYKTAACLSLSGYIIAIAILFGSLGIGGVTQ